MTDDALNRAKRALQLSQSRGLQSGAPPPDLAKVNSVLERARKAVEDRPLAEPAMPPPRPAPAPGVERVRVHMTCGAKGGAFIGLAERHGSVLRLVGHEALPQARTGGTGRAGLLSGEYQLDAVEGWTCPLCHSGASGVWMCQCPEFRGALHCGGTDGRARHCACGRIEERHLVEAPTFQVRGESVGATSAPTRSGASLTRPAPMAPGALVPSSLRNR